MGISTQGAQFLMACLARGMDVSTTCTLGQQHLFTSRNDVLDACTLAGDPDVRARVERLAEPDLARFGTATALLTAMGANRIDVIDISDFEGAELLADLNRPVPEDWWGRYTFVLDGGVSEHISDAAQCLRNAASLVAPGGHLVSITPADGQSGHGLYQFGPEFYYRNLFDSGEFVALGVLLCVEGIRTRWYSVADPKELGERITFAAAGPADWYVCARRVDRSDAIASPAVTPGAGAGGAPGPASDETAQQSDYQRRWDESDAAPSAAVRSSTRPAIVARRSRSVPLRARVAREAHRAVNYFGAVSRHRGIDPIQLDQWSRQVL